MKISEMQEKGYIDEVFGVRPGPNQSSFNNIIYSVWDGIGKKIKGMYTQEDEQYLYMHMIKTKDKDGLYKPKNSHDNIFYKIIGSRIFHMSYDSQMNFWRAAKDIGLYRFWDVILLAYLIGPKFLQKLAIPFLWIPNMFMVNSVKDPTKIRPEFWDSKDPRFPWWFLPKKKIHDDWWYGGTVHAITWLDFKKRERTTQHMQNDGVHLALFKLYMLKDDKRFDKTRKKCENLLVERYGKDYVFGIINNYFRDRQHPTIAIWKGNGGIL